MEEDVLVKRYTTDIRATLLNFKPGQTSFVPYNDMFDENGKLIKEGSKTHTNVWDARYRTLKSTENIPGNFHFRTMKEPYGTLIFRGT